MDEALLVIDEGTSSVRAALVAPDGAFGAIVRRPLASVYPRPGWVEQDAAEIWANTLAAAREALSDAAGVRGIGLTNQRETLVFWDRATGAALAPAIVWQDRRSADICVGLRDAGHEAAVQRATGLVLDPYFSASKIAWALDAWPQLRAAGDRLALGTIDSWLMFKLTGGRHVTDATNASRTMLMGLTGGWDAGLCELFGVPIAALPEIVDSAGLIATTDPALFGWPIPICGVAGDQQAAAIGQACLAPGETKATFGTGAFVLAHAGAEPPVSDNRLLATVAWQLAGTRTYALEGSLFVAGQLVQWLRDELGLIASSAETDAIARSVESSAGVTVVPAFSGLGAPHWRPEARGAILGLTLGSGRAHIVRAALEGIVNQCAALQQAFAADGAPWSALRIDGGMAANDFLAQNLADLTGIAVERPANVECTMLGAAIIASVGAGIHRSLGDAAAAMRRPGASFAPAISEEQRVERLAAWSRAVGAVKEMGE